ncbi:response regulator transcription factor [Sulfurospirillum cavolei]|uniref:response regulator transcription factor n=1 Tax=Sulfurospirillum cavolei TaxID=366522 RepID=UPI000764C344|nr:response regulator transcription factor [Sulfurospirillum cavolei]
MKILLLEDDYAYKESIQDSLEEMGYAVDAFEDGQKALDALFENRYHLALLDIRVPHVDGYEILKQIRKAKLDLPIIFITSLTDINNLSLGYELGCNDYIRKPFSLKELQYRVTQALNAYHMRTTVDITLCHGFSYRLEDQSLWFDAMQIPLTQYEKKLLFLLVKNRGNYISTENIHAYVWEDKAVGDNDIRMLVKKLRDKTDKELIVTAKGIGYKIEKCHA